MVDKPNPNDALKLYDQAKKLRVTHEQDWKKAAAYCLPMHYSSWNTEGPAAHNQNQDAARRVNYDSTGARSLPKYVAILERLATPIGQKWHNLAPSDDYLRNKHSVRKYFDQLQRQMFKLRYHPQARFRTTTNEVYSSMGAYGNGPLYLEERKVTPLIRDAGFTYIACSLRDIYFLVDDAQQVSVVFRRMWLNVRQFGTKFPNEPLPSVMKSEADKPNPDENIYFEIIHYVYPQAEDKWDPSALDQRRHPVHSVYICVKSKEVIGEVTGYRSMPYKIPRTSTVAGDPYGYSPAVMALSALGGASQMKKTNLKQGQKAADPVLLAHDDGVMNGSLDGRPGSINYGAMTKEGRPLVQALQTGDFRVGEILLADERGDIEDAFFVTLFRILKDRPEMTATQFLGETAEVAALLSPTMGRLQSEMLGPIIEREIDIMTEMGVMPEMPPELVEARGDYNIIYTSPLAKNIYAEESAGFMRNVEAAIAVSTVTGKVELLDTYNFEVALPEMAENAAVPARWLNDDKTKKVMRDQRAQREEQQQMMDNAPALASVVKTAADMEG